MQHTVYFLILLTMFISCADKPRTQKFGNEASLAGSDTICFPIDENTTYESRAIFQFEENGREYLSFKTMKEKGSHIHIFDIEKQNVHKTIPWFRQGPHAVPSVLGGFPIDMNHILTTSKGIQFCIINDKGQIQYKSPNLYNFKDYLDGKGFGLIAPAYFISRYHEPAIIKDSVLYFPQSQIGYPHTKESWKTSNIFASLDLRTGEMQPTRFCYPSIFDQEEILRTRSYDCAHSYGYTGKDVAVSFSQSDSIYVSSDFQHVKAYLAKSRHFPSLRPKPYNAQIDNEVRLRKEAMEPDYWHLIYDKYRKVFYRFARFPYEFPKDRNAMIDEDRGREFSIVILNDKYEIIGETKFPGHTYAYMLCFVGKKGLYISLNNQDNPIFSEDELYFHCLTLKYSPKQQ